MLFRSLLFAVGFVGRQFGSPFCGAIPSAATRSSSPRCPDDRTGLRTPPLARALLPLARALAARGLGEAAGHLVAVERRRSGRGGRAAPSRSAHLGRCPPHRRSTPPTPPSPTATTGPGSSWNHSRRSPRSLLRRAVAHTALSQIGRASCRERVVP